MRAIDVVARGAISALGTGASASSPSERSRVAHDAELSRAGLRKPFAARVEIAETARADRAELLLLHAARELVESLDVALIDWRKRRVGVCVGTSGGGMPSFMRTIETIDAGGTLSVELARSSTYFGPLTAIKRALEVEPVRYAQTLAACASSTFAIGIGCRWLEIGEVDLVIAGGYDALSVFIAAGFECLGATTTDPRPFRAERDGLALGEGAALLALCPEGAGQTASLGRIFGFGASSDAVHVTAPDRTGAGLERAARRALDDSSTAPERIALVSAHGTGTAYNDSAESRALKGALGDSSSAVVHPFKAVIGHTLGAAGALETLSALRAIEDGVLPPAVGRGAPEPELALRLLESPEKGTIDRCLKLSSAFGGANAALVLGSAAASAPRPRRARRPVFVRAVGSPVTDPKPIDPSNARLGRMDSLSLLAVLAALDAIGSDTLPRETAIVVGTSAATIEINADFERRRKKRGPEPRRFPATSPNLCAGECSITLGLTGPSLSVGADLAASLEALAVARDLVAIGDADHAVVVAVEQVGPTVRAIWSGAAWPEPEHGALALVLTAEGPARGELGSERLAEITAQARASGGRLADAPPGWPTLRTAIQALTRAEPHT